MREGSHSFLYLVPGSHITCSSWYGKTLSNLRMSWNPALCYGRGIQDHICALAQSLLKGIHSLQSHSLTLTCRPPETKKAGMTPQLRSRLTHTYYEGGRVHSQGRSSGPGLGFSQDGAERRYPWAYQRPLAARDPRQDS